MGDFVGANSDFNKALSISPHDKQAGEALLDLWRRQVAANPNAVNGHLGLARAYLRTGDLESAQGEYREVVRLDPNNPQLPTARRCVKLALAQQASQKSLATAKALGSAGQLKDAYEKTNEALSYAANNTHALLYKGELAQKLGQPLEARQAYIAVLEEDPKNTEAIKALKAMSKPGSQSVSATKPQAAHKSGRRTAATTHKSKTASNPAPHKSVTLASKPSPTNTVPQPGSITPLSNATTSSAVAPAVVATADIAATSTLANFTGSLRDLSLAQRNQSKQLDSLNQSSLKSLALPSDEPVLRPELAKFDIGSINDSVNDPIPKCLN